MTRAGKGIAAYRPVRRARSWLACLVAALTLAGCVAEPQVSPAQTSTPSSVVTTSGGPTLATGSTQHSLEVDGRIRMYRVYRPEGITTEAPLVVMLHGGLGSAWDAERAYGWNAVADRDQAVVLYPDAVGQAWNVGDGCCGAAGSQGIDDVAFITRAIAEVADQVPVDPKRIYVTGMSVGGMMAYRLACETDVLAAIGPVAATMLGDCPNPAPMSVIAINGTGDKTVPYTGGASLGLAPIEGPPVPDVIETWRTTARCGGEIIRVAGAVTTSVAQCPTGRTVELVTIEGGTHEWPGVQRGGPLDAAPTATASPAATPTPGSATVDATAEIWAFFGKHQR